MEIEIKSGREGGKEMLMQKVAEIKQMAEELDIPLEELLGGSGMMEQKMDGMDYEGEEEEMDMSSPDIEKAIKMMKAMRAE